MVLDMIYLNYYLIFINVVSFVMFFVDKNLAKNHKKRISERTLFILIFMGGVIGACLGMGIFRHKTKKVYFHVCNILALLLWGYIIYLIFMVK